MYGLTEHAWEYIPMPDFGLHSSRDMPVAFNSGSRHF